MKTETTVVMNDLQIPFQDNQVLYGLVVPFINDIKPDRVLLNGDVADCYALSTHDKLRADVEDLDVEVDESAKLMKALQDVPEKVWQGGNHEFRLERYLANNREKLKALGRNQPRGFADFFRLKEHGFKWVPYTGQEYNFKPGVTLLGKLMVTHGFLVRQHSAVSAKAHFERLGCSSMIGHTHRMGFYSKTNQKGVHGSWENGCLCMMNPEFVMFPDWQQCISVVTVWGGGFFNVQQLPILERRVLHFGKDRYEVARRDRKR